MYSKTVVVSPVSHTRESTSCFSVFTQSASLLLSIALVLPVLSGCSDSSDNRGSDIETTLPQIDIVVEPADGQANVVRTSWMTLRFSEPLPAPSSLTAVLDCDSSRQEISLDWVGNELLVINPKQEFPEQTVCTISWEHGNSTGTSSFEVAAAGAPAVLAYDRDDDTSLTPFPDDVWLIEAEEAATGYQVALPIPNRDEGIHTLYSALLAPTVGLDGFSPAAAMVVPVPGPLDADSLPTTPEESLSPLATIGLFVAEPGVADLGRRVPFYLLQRDEENADGSLEYNLLVFPQQLLEPRQSYVLVVTRRALIDVTRPLEPSPFFVAASAGELSNGTAAGQRVGELLQEILPVLEEHGSPPLYSDDIALAVKFTARSDEGLSEDAMSIRLQLQELPVPTYTVTSVEAVTDQDAEVAALVHGTWDVPSFRDGSFIARDASGAPEYTGTVSVPFVLALPEAATFGPVPVTMYQHGQPGSAETGLPRIAPGFASFGHALIGFTDIANREIIKDGGIAALTQAIFATLLVDNRMPEYLGTLPLAEQLAFIRLISALGNLDVFPVGAPDGVPDIDVAAPLTYLGISQGSTHGTRLVSYAPEIRAAHLAVAGERWSGIQVHQTSDMIYDFAGQVFTGLTRADLYVSLSLVQMGYDPQDAVNHARYMYREPHDLGDEDRASILATAGLADSLVPPYSTETAAWGFGLPHLEPVQSGVPSLELIQGPVSANVNQNTTAAYYQYVPVGVDSVPPTPGCEALNEAEGHFCAQVAPEAQEQSMEFFRSAVEDSVPTIINPLSP